MRGLDYFSVEGFEVLLTGGEYFQAPAEGGAIHRGVELLDGLYSSLEAANSPFEYLTSAFVDSKLHFCAILIF